MQWQQGLLIYGRGLPMMFDELVRLFGIKSIFTIRTNQDTLENLFSQLGFLGGKSLVDSNLSFCLETSF